MIRLLALMVAFAAILIAEDTTLMDVAGIETLVVEMIEIADGTAVTQRFSEDARTDAPCAHLGLRSLEPRGGHEVRERNEVTPLHLAAPGNHSMQHLPGRDVTSVNLAPPQKTNRLTTPKNVVAASEVAAAASRLSSVT